jgi:quinoprotein glucose dehydrogenase
MRVYESLIAIILTLFGTAMLVGGIWLATLGGSWFYSASGAATAMSGLMLFRSRPSAYWLYGLTLIGTLIWALLESGADWWALAPRGALPVVLGILMLPMLLVRLGNGPATDRRYRPGAAVLLGALAVSAGIGGYAALLDPHDQPGRFAKTGGSTAEVDTAGVPDGEWQAYGRTSYGRRYSPLTQITPSNVATLEVAWTYQTGQIRGAKDPGETTYEVTPLVFDDTMYICTPFATVIALDPVSGAEKWRFDPMLKEPNAQTTQHMTCRGVTYFDGSKVVPVTPATATQDTTAPSSLTQEATAPNTSASETSRVADSAGNVTTTSAGVPQNIVTGQAKAGDPNPQVDRETASAASTPSSDCLKRLFVPTSDGRLIAISAKDGRICPGFGGEDGTINLWANMPNVTPGSAYATSPPVVTDHLIVVGGAVNDNVATTSPSGVIRAYDVNTGDLVWNFDSKKPNALAPIAKGQTYSENAPNSWSVSSYDPKLKLIYVPMGNESPDQYGAHRTPEVEKYSASVLALEADTGKVAWVFQTVHHDLWDMDVPAQPALLDLTINGKTVPALVQATKQGEVFVLDRRNGTPILPVTEEAAPQKTVAGDFAAPTQPVSAISFKPKPLTEADMWGATPIDQMLCRIKFRQLDYDGRFTPPTEKGSIIYPGNFGTFNWGSVAVDPQRQVMFAMPVYLAFTSQMIKRHDTMTREVTSSGEPVFNENFGADYASRMGPLVSPLGLPCQQPPWGYVAGVDLTTGRTVYQHVNGTIRDLSPLPLPFRMGVPGIGGPIVTGGGVAFLSGTLDYYVRGYDLADGKELWRARLPAGGQATPSTYLGRDGKQYLVVVAGGHGSTGTKAGDSIIAYRLPN